MFNKLLVNHHDIAFLEGKIKFLESLDCRNMAEEEHRADLIEELRSAINLILEEEEQWIKS